MFRDIARQPRATLSRVEARALALRAQGFGAAASAAIDLLDRLGAIQLDSVNVVARSHHLIPFARLGAYDVAGFHDAVYRQRRGFEYWGHEASILPIRDYRYFLPRMLRRREQARPWWGAVREEHADLYAEVLRRIRAEGPLSSAAFADPRHVSGRWWRWKPAKLVLEDLFDRGELMCRERTAGFARLYDLPERVLPSDLETANPGAPAAARYLMLRAIEAAGIANALEASDYYRLKPTDWHGALRDLLEAGEVLPVAVDGSRGLSYVVPQALDGRLTVPEHRPTFLSPFDSLVWERDRTERLFGFRYRIEIYTPEPKRQFGYYVLPLLARGHLAGRADLKLDRASGTLLARRVALAGAEWPEAEQALADLARFLGAEQVVIERAESRWPRVVL